MSKRDSVVILFLIIVLGMNGCAPSYLSIRTLSPVNPRSVIGLDSGWVCRNIADVKLSGEQLSDTDSSLTDWLPAMVPGTVLTTLLNDSLIPDPFYGMNNAKIPDIYDTGRNYYTYWFVKDFHAMVPEHGGEIWLRFRGVNYGCDIFLNGHRLNEKTHYGMFLRQTYNITSFLSRSGDNRLAVLVYPPDPVGNPNGGQGGDGTIARNVGSQYTAGWDWIQPIHDRNTGIWDRVSLVKTGTVFLRYPHIVTIVPGKRFPSGPQAPAILRSSIRIQNPQANSIHGKVFYLIDSNLVTEDVTVPPDSTIKVQFRDFTLMNPKLWWPNGCGGQPLYHVRFGFAEDGNLFDEKDITIGIRQIETRWDRHTGSRQVLVNGQKIFIRGGDWIVSDAMLRLSPERYDAEVRFHRDMNLNLIRVWGGSITERPEFYDACDKYGLLVFQDFWMSGDCNGKWTDPMKKDDQWVRRQYPDDHKLFLASVADQVRMLRNHPSLAFYCGGNEIPPPEDILVAMQDSLLPSLDSTRYFFTYSNEDSMSYNTIGYTGDGPYFIQPYAYFWEHRFFPFNSEIGSVGLGDYHSLERFIPPQDMVLPGPAFTQMDSVWRYHKPAWYGTFIDAYGVPDDVRDYADKAQLVNYNEYRALAEGHLSHMWDWYTGFIIWKTQNPWTAMRGQMYDYYLDPNAGLYGLHHACEPLHVMCSPADGMVMVVNNTFHHYHDLMLQATAYDIAGRDSTITQWFIEVSPSSVQKFFSVQKYVDTYFNRSGGFIDLRLITTSHKVLSDNLYWYPDSSGDYSGLDSMTAASVGVTARRVDRDEIAVTISDPAGGPVAFFNRVSLVDSATMKRILPVFYSDNYVSVLPGREKIILIQSEPDEDLSKAVVSVKGWNVGKKIVDIK